MGGSGGLPGLERQCVPGMPLLLSASRALLACKISQGLAREISWIKFEAIVLRQIGLAPVAWHG